MVNMKTQYGAGLRTGMLIGASAFALMMLALIGLAAASDSLMGSRRGPRATDGASADWSVHAFTGGINTDKLGGIGSSKSTGGIDLELARRDFSASARVWHIAEKLDDDAGISPRYGGTIDFTRRIAGPWRAGALQARTDANTFTYATVGLAAQNADLDLLVPLNDSRFGFRARLRAPLSGCWFARMHFEYTGRQDPDIKVSNIGLGVGRSFSHCR